MAERITNILKDMADAIREKTSTSEKIVGRDIPDAIKDMALAAAYPSGMYYTTLDESGNVTGAEFFGMIPSNRYLPSTVKTVTVKSTTISDNCFKGTSVQTVNLHDNITTLGIGSFWSNQIKTLNFPDGTTNRIPTGVTEIPDQCFYQSTGLTQLLMHDGIKNIGASAFYQCKLAVQELPESLETIGNSAFQNVTSVGFTKIPKNVKTIGQSAFASCTAITSLTFEGTPTSLHNSALYGITNLTVINVPWAEGEVAGAPWGATKATINYNYTGG